MPLRRHLTRMKNTTFERSFALLAFAVIGATCFKPAYAAQPAPALTCDQMSAEIQAISAEMQGSATAMQGNMAEQMRLMQRQMTASALAGAIPLPFVGSVVGQAVGAADRARAAEVQARQQATQQDYMNRLPVIAARMQTLAVQYEAQCLSGTAGR